MYPCSDVTKSGWKRCRLLVGVARFSERACSDLPHLLAVGMQLSGVEDGHSRCHCNEPRLAFEFEILTDNGLLMVCICHKSLVLLSVCSRNVS